MKSLIALCAACALCACSPAGGDKDTAPNVASGPVKPAVTTAPAGLYKLDLAHTSLNFRVDHIGMSHYTARFTRIDGTLQIDPANPAAAKLVVNVDPASIQTNYPLKDIDFDAELRGPNFLDAAGFPKLTYRSTKVELTGPNTARVTGDLSFRGVTRPLVLETAFNDGYPPGGLDPGARIGFSAHGSLKRSDFGMSYGIPAPGTKMGVSDAVEIIIETEFTMP